MESGFGEGLGFRERTMVRELQPGVVLVEVMADGGGEVVDEGTEGQVVLQSLNGVATCTGGSRGGLGVGDGEDGRRDGGDDGFKERMEGDCVIFDFRERYNMRN